MKKITLFVYFLLLTTLVYAQDAPKYDAQRLKTVSRIWGEAYLFHPAVVRADKSVEWEKQLVDFLPLIRENISGQEFVQAIQTGLLDALDDPLTRMQPGNENTQKKYGSFTSNDLFDYLKITGSQLSSTGSLIEVYEQIKAPASSKPLVIDLRVSEKLNFPPQPYCLFRLFFVDADSGAVPIGHVRYPRTPGMGRVQ